MNNRKSNYMKKIIISLTFLCTGLLAYNQTNAVDELFNKYSERDGFTYVTISGKMFNMFSEKDQENSIEGDVIRKLNSIRILTVEDSVLNTTINFYTELNKKEYFKGFEELMVVKEGQDITKFLIRQTGNIISELIVITGGPQGNSVISIKGNLDMKSLSGISEEIGIGDPFQ